MRSVWRLMALSATLTLGCVLDAEGLGTANDDGGRAPTAGSGGDGNAAGTAGAGSSGASGAGALPNFDGGSENCLDGIDNDGNTLADCADPACAPGYQCVPQAPPSWKGYVRTRGDAYGAAPGPACADGSEPTRYSSAPAGPAECSPCGCGALAGGQCGAAPLLCHPGSSNCGGAASDWTALASDGGCHAGSASTTSLSCKLGPIPVLAPGACPPSGGEFSNEDPFTSVTDVCRTDAEPGGGCEKGESCVPRGAGQYAGYVCVEQVGEHACPKDWGLQLVGYTGASDSRGCTACSCDASSAQCAGAEYRFWDDPYCLIGDESVGSAQCKDLSGLTDFGAWSFERSKLPVVSGTCTASGGEATGLVYPTGALTFCCRAL